MKRRSFITGVVGKYSDIIDSVKCTNPAKSQKYVSKGKLVYKKLHRKRTCRSECEAGLYAYEDNTRLNTKCLYQRLPEEEI
ncbi:MAG: hypothetical protein MJ092_05370 [Lachnospiraceae bacterium]|nr:hypothetical protein [Lachnospiraceae bacterium]